MFSGHVRTAAGGQRPFVLPLGVAERLGGLLQEKWSKTYFTAPAVIPLIR
jgi:hypothetical protein